MSHSSLGCDRFMEVQSKPGPNGTPGTSTAPNPGTAVAPSDPVRLLGIILRGLTIVLTFIATILMGIAKQSKTFVGMDDYGITETFTLTVKSTYSSSYVYFIAANAIVFFVSSVSFALSIISRSSFSKCKPVLSLVDLTTVALLFSCNGAAAAITVVAKNGTNKFAWEKFCDAANTFCSEVTAALVLSMIASLAYFLLLFISIIGFHKRSQ